MNQGNIFVSLPKNWLNFRSKKETPNDFAGTSQGCVKKNILFCRFLHEGTILKEMSFGVSSHKYWDSCPCCFFGSDLVLANIRNPLKHPAMFCQPKTKISGVCVQQYLMHGWFTIVCILFSCSPPLNLDFWEALAWYIPTMDSYFWMTSLHEIHLTSWRFGTKKAGVCEQKIFWFMRFPIFGCLGL